MSEHDTLLTQIQTLQADNAGLSIELNRLYSEMEEDEETWRASAEAAEADRDRLREALLYYASPESWRTLEVMGTHSANLDRGMVARAALRASLANEEPA